jgi:hypothetical protein
VKLDGDGQMNPDSIAALVSPLIDGRADYAKGNRFHSLEFLEGMPAIRIIGNALLSLLTKISSGYWHIFDPTNGFTAVNREVLENLPLEKISNRYFFESDMLFRLNIIRAVVEDVPMRAFYGSEKSNLKITNVLLPFFFGHFKNFWKRIFYNYYLRDMSVASIQLPLGLGAILFGLFYGAYNWGIYAAAGQSTPVGTVVIAALSISLGVQFLLAFLAYDIQNVPRIPIHLILKNLVKS